MKSQYAYTSVVHTITCRSNTGSLPFYYSVHMYYREPGMKVNQNEVSQVITKICLPTVVIVNVCGYTVPGDVAPQVTDL